MTDTKTKHKLSIPEILLHLVLLTIAFIPYNVFLFILFPSEKEHLSPLYYSILTIEVCIVFFFFSIKRQLKVDKLPFILILLCSFFNLFEVFFTILDIITDRTPPPHSPYLEIFYRYIPILDYLPLPTYLTGYINKKLFWAIASITIAGFAFFFIWNFFIDRFLH